MSHLIIKNLLDDCDSGEPARQVPAIIKLQDLKVFEAVPNLFKLLDSPEENVRQCAAEALGWLGDDDIETVGPALMKMLDESEALSRTYALEALALLDYSPALNKTKYLLCNDPDWIVRATSAEAIANFADVGDEDILTILELALNDPYKPVRSYAACSIGLLGIPTPELLSKLQMYLSSEESLDTKAEILAARYRLGVRDDITKLLELLNIADQHLAGVIVTILKDLVERETPVILVDDSSVLCEALNKVGKSFPIERNHADQVIAQLEMLKIQL